MSTQDWTPGPWEPGKDETGGGKGFVYSEGGTVAKCQFPDVPFDEMYANTFLIAAAPEMYEALRGLISIVRAFSYTTQLGKTQRERLAAAEVIIAKATGHKAREAHPSSTNKE